MNRRCGASCWWERSTIRNEAHQCCQLIISRRSSASAKLAQADRLARGLGRPESCSKPKARYRLTAKILYDLNKSPLGIEPQIPTPRSWAPKLFLPPSVSKPVSSGSNLGNHFRGDVEPRLLVLVLVVRTFDRGRVRKRGALLVLPDAFRLLPSSGLVVGLRPDEVQNVVWVQEPSARPLQSCRKSPPTPRQGTGEKVATKGLTGRAGSKCGGEDSKVVRVGELDRLDDAEVGQEAWTRGRRGEVSFGVQYLRARSVSSSLPAKLTATPTRYAAIARKLTPYV